MERRFLCEFRISFYFWIVKHKSLITGRSESAEFDGTTQAVPHGQRRHRTFECASSAAMTTPEKFNSYINYRFKYARFMPELQFWQKFLDNPEIRSYSSNVVYLRDVVLYMKRNRRN
jgi:hypothetical protein